MLWFFPLISLSIWKTFGFLSTIKYCLYFLFAGWQVRLENKAAINSGILCLIPEVVTVLGGVVQSLYEEWQMKKKYSTFSRSSARLVHETEIGGPPRFEKLQVGTTKQQSAYQGKPSCQCSRAFTSPKSIFLFYLHDTTFRSFYSTK